MPERTVDTNRPRSAVKVLEEGEFIIDYISVEIKRPQLTKNISLKHSTSRPAGSIARAKAWKSRLLSAVGSIACAGRSKEGEKI